MYASFIYNGDSLVIITDTDGNIIQQKLFGLQGETDEVDRMTISGSFIYFYGTFAESSYNIGGNHAHFVYKIDIEMSIDASCSALPLADADVTFE